VASLIVHFQAAQFLTECGKHVGSALPSFDSSLLPAGFSNRRLALHGIVSFN